MSQPQFDLDAKYAFFAILGDLLTGQILQFDGTRKENVVLKMDVLMQVLLEFPQAVIERMEGRAGIRWGGETSTQTADFSN